ncbi:MAG: hypothetical protein II872_04985 [Clostridia bacterium]|nr:hypothetical protein [Clostridia bacterium]
MKKLISIVIIGILLFATAGCSCGLSCCGSGQKVPEAKGGVSIAYDDPYVKKVLGYFQANQGYVITFSELRPAEGEQADYNALAGKACIAVVKDEAIAEALRAAGWADVSGTENPLGLVVLSAPDGNEPDRNGDAVSAFKTWLGGEEPKYLIDNPDLIG